MLKKLSVGECLQELDAGKSFVALYQKADSDFQNPITKAFDTISSSDVTNTPIYTVDIDTNVLTEKELKRLSVSKVPQLKFYYKGFEVASMIGKVSTSEIRQQFRNIYMVG